jgi:hypothetical protein
MAGVYTLDAQPVGRVPFHEAQKQSNFKHFLYRLIGETRPDPHTLPRYAPHYPIFQLPAPGTACSICYHLFHRRPNNVASSSLTGPHRTMEWAGARLSRGRATIHCPAADGQLPLGRSAGQHPTTRCHTAAGDSCSDAAQTTTCPL